MLNAHNKYMCLDVHALQHRQRRERIHCMREARQEQCVGALAVCCHQAGLGTELRHMERIDRRVVRAGVGCKRDRGSEELCMDTAASHGDSRMMRLRT